MHRDQSAQSPADPLRPFENRSAAALTTERALFGPLSTEDPVDVLVRRIRTAIRLGVLRDGQKLPKEADLAQQFGVAVFSLREALGILREEGLIRTRVGKNGGSYVDQPRASESMAEEELRRLTATELRDLGDWRSAVAMQAARLAAQRGSAESHLRLRSHCEELREASSSGAGRRALGRFHMSLAAAAQSMRLTRAEVSLHEQFDWLVEVILQTPAQRESFAKRMQAVVRAVEGRKRVEAAKAMNRLISFAVTELMRARLRSIASQQRAESAPEGDLNSQLQQTMTGVVGLLVDIADELAQRIGDERSIEAMSMQLSRAFLPRLIEFDDVVHGVGYMAEVGVLQGAKYWMQWWQRTDEGLLERDYSHDLDPAHDDFYDYGSQDYVAVPRVTGRPNAMGPYIDHGGVDDYLITISVPLYVADAFLGVICADVRVAGLERALSPWLAREADTCLVLSADSRVLLTNSVEFNVGDFVSEETSELTLADEGALGWKIARSPS